MKRRLVVVYIGWCSGPGNAQGWRALLSFVSWPRSWLSAYSAAGGDILLRHWRWGALKWGFDLRQLSS